MTDKTKSEEAYALVRSNPQRYKLLESGAVYDMEGKHIVAHTGVSEHQITKDNARILAERRWQKGMRAKMRGMVLGAGMEVSPNVDDDELASKASNALELYVAHLGKTFLESKNLRGMGEAFNKLTEPFTKNSLEDEQDEQEQKRQNALAFQEMVRMARQIDEQQKAIPGEVIAEE